MAKKQYYCIDFRNMHNGIHGLFVFDTRKEAEFNFKLLKETIIKLELDRGKGKISEQSADNQYRELISDIYLNSSSFVEEVDFRNKQEKVIRNLLEECYEIDNLRYIVVNFRNCLDLYV